MDATSLRHLLQESPIVASVQLGGGSPLSDLEPRMRLAQSCALGGCRLLRVEGADAIATVRKATGLPVIGRIDHAYADSEVHSTPSLVEVRQLLDSGCEIIAMDASHRKRPHAERLSDLVVEVRRNGRLAMADCDSLDTAHYAAHCGFDLVGTGLSEYTGRNRLTDEPDWTFLRQAADSVEVPILAEGRFVAEWQAEVALRIGAHGVVVGDALCDPIRQTRRFVSAAERRFCRVGAFDIGVHWIRFAEFDENWHIRDTAQRPLEGDPSEWIDWMKEVVSDREIDCIGVASPGTVNPRNGHVWETVDGWSTRFAEDVLGFPTFALNRGLAAAWAHGCHREFAGRRVVTLLIGKGLTCGFVANHRLMMGSMGQYPRLEELSPHGADTFEELLGGVSIISSPTTEQQARANQAIAEAIRVLQAMLLPDVIVVGGPVGVAEWVELQADYDKGWTQCRIVVSPFGGQAALYGAAALALFPPKALRAR